MTRIISSIALLSVLLSCGTGEAKRPGMCAKEPMAPDGIVRLSKIEVYPQYLDEYVKHAAEVGEVSLRTEPGVLTMYAVQEREAPAASPFSKPTQAVRPTTDISTRNTSGNTSRKRCT